MLFTHQPANARKLAYGFNALKLQTPKNWPIMFTSKQTGVAEKRLSYNVLLTILIFHYFLKLCFGIKFNK